MSDNSNNTVPVLNSFLRKSWRAHSKILPYSRSIEFGDFDIYSWVVFANSIGGDHRSFIEFDKRYDLEYLSRLYKGENKVIDYKQRLGTFIADVSGHDFEDVLLVHNIHSSLFTAIPYELEINGEVSKNLFEKLNTRLFNSTSKAKFATAVYNEITRDFRARFIVAGHPAPLIFNVESGDFLDVDYKTGFPLGLFQSCHNVDQDPDIEVPDTRSEFEVVELQLPRKCIIVMYTDGVLEAEAPDGEEYGLERLKRVIADNREKKARDLFRAILLDNNRHLDKRRALDDRTMVVVKCKC